MSEHTFDPCWAIVEVMGHSQFAGLVSETPVAGTNMLRVDIPEVDEHPAFTKFLGGGSIFAITPCTEETARRAVRAFRPRPPHFYEAPRIAAAHAAADCNDDDYDPELE